MRDISVVKNPSKSMLLFVVPFIILFSLIACAIPISYYDSATYTQLTSLKAEVTTLVESFDTKPYSENQDKIEETILDFKKAYEYEKGKGRPNSETSKQFDKINDLLMSCVEDYKGNLQDELGKYYFQEVARILGQAFDIAISTENRKNRDKR